MNIKEFAPQEKNQKTHQDISQIDKWEYKTQKWQKTGYVNRNPIRQIPQ